MLTQERLKELFHYCPDTGVFTRVMTSRGGMKGGIAGSLSHGYLLIGIDNKRYKVARLAYLYMEGYFPEFEIDHRNGVKDDNRWCNLRHVSHACNMQNQKQYTSNTSGFTGVRSRVRRGIIIWEARISVRNKAISIGLYDDIITAALARVEFEDNCEGWTCNEQHHNRIKLRELGFKT